MIDRSVNLGKLTAWTAWVVVGGLIVLCGVAMAVDLVYLGQFFGFAACAFSAFAATMQIRCYFVRVANMIRNVMDGGDDDDDDQSPPTRGCRPSETVVRPVPGQFRR